jgi:PAS domain S-box-containing protein
MNDNSQRRVAELERENADLKERLEAVLHRQHLLQAVVEGTTDAVFVKDLQGRYLLANAAASGFAGKPVEEILGRDDTELFSPESAVRIMERDRLVMDSGETQTVEEVATAAGQTRIYQATKGPYRDEIGRVIGVIGIARDVTERNQAENQLRASEERFATIFRSSPIGACITTLEEGTFLDANPAFLRKESLNLESILGRTALDLGYWRDRDERQKVVQILRQTGTVINWEMSHRLKDGTVTHSLRSLERIVLEGRDCVLTMLTDITDRKAAEQALQASGERFSKVFHGSPDPISLVGLPDGRVIDVNDRFVEHSGYSRDEVIGRTTLELGFWDDAAQRDRFYQLFREQGGVNGLDATLRTKSGELREVQLSSVRIELDGRSCMMTSSRDVTAQKRAERALLASEQRFRALIEHSFDAIALIDQNGALLYGSPAATRITGRTSDEWIGQGVFERIHPADVPLARDIFAKLGQNPTRIQHTQFRYLHKDETWIWLDVTATNLLEQPAVRAIVINYRNITERKRTETALAVNEARFRAIVERGGDAFFLLDANGIVIFDTPPTAQNLGYSEEENLGRSSFELVHPDDLLTVRSLFARLLQEPDEEVRCQFQALHQNGSWRWIDVIGCNRLADPNLQGIVVSYRDITERRRAEEESQRFGRILDDSLNEIYIFDAISLRFDRVNSGAQRNLGYTMEELHLLTPLDLKPKFNRASFEALVEPLRSGLQQRIVFEAIHHRKNGSTYPVEVHLQLSSGAGPQFFVAIILDITARRQAETALSESEARYRLLADNTDDFVALNDTRGNRLYISPSFYRVTGWTPEEVQQLNWHSCLHPDDLPMIERTRAANLAGESTLIEHRIRCKDGSWIWVELRCKPLKNPDGRVSLLLLSSREITARKRAEQAVRDNEARLMGMVNTAMDAIITVDEDQNVVLFNPAAERIFHWSGAEVMGKSIQQFIPERFHFAHGDQIRQFGNSATTVRQMGERRQVVGRRRDDSEFPADASILKVQVGDRRFFTIILRDISERKRAEAALWESEGRLRLLVQSADIGLWDWNLVTNEVYFSPEWKRQLGYSDAEIPGQYEEWQSRLHPGDRDRALAAVSDFREGRRNDYDVEFRLRHKDGSWRWILARADLLSDAAGQPYRMLGCHVDITERKQAEEDLRRSEHRFATVFHNSPVAIALTTLAEGRILDANEAYCRLLGFQRDELIGHTTLERNMVDPAERARHLELLKRDGHLQNTESQYRDRSGRIREVLISAERLDLGGEPVILGISQDITERKQVEEALRESENRLNLAVSTTDLGIFEHDHRTNAIYWSPRMRRIFGWGDSEPASLPGYLGLIPAEDRALVTGTVQQAHDPAGDGQFRVEHRIVLRDGGVRWVNILSHTTFEGTADDRHPVRTIGTVADVTARRQAEESLRASEERLSYALNATADGVWDWNIKTGTVLFSPRWISSLGYSPEEVPASVDFWKSVVHPEDLPRVMETVEAHLAKQTPVYECENRLRMKSGRYRSNLDRGKVVEWDKDGSPLRMVGTDSDITERKRTEDTLREKEHLLSESQRIAHIGSWVFDPTGHVIWSDETYRIYGVSPDTFAPNAESLLDLIHPEDRSAMQSWIAACTAAEHPGPLEFRTILTDGSIRHLSGRGELMFDTQNRPSYMTGTVQDITERKLVELALRATEANLVAAQERAKMGSWELDLQTQTGWFSPGMFILFDRDRALGTPTFDEFLELVHADERQWVSESPARLAEIGQDSSGDFRFRSVHGNVRYFNFTIRCLRNSQGQTVRLAGTLLDITERKQVEESLAAERQLLRTMADNLPAYVFVKDTAGRYLFVNLTHARQLGLTSEAEMLGKTAFDFFPADIARLYDADDMSVLQSGTPVIEREEPFEADGRLGWFLTTKVPLRDAHGQITGLVGIALDITARKQVEAALADERNLLRTLVDHIPDFIFVKDTQSRQLLNNAANLRLIGAQTDAEVVGKTVFDLYPRELAQRYYDEDQLVMRSGQAQLNQEESVLDHDGQEHWLLSSKVPLRDINGKCIGLVGIKRDITEHRRINTELAASRERLEILSRQLIATQESERRSLARELHDEIGQSLTVAKLNVQAVQQQAIETTAQPRLVETIAILETTLDQVRNLALQLRPSILDDLGLLPALRWHSDMQAKRAGFTAWFDADPLESRLAPEIEIACFRIVQEAITNVIRHAHAKNVWVEMRNEPLELSFSIRDDGTGFDVQAARQKAVAGASLGLLGMEERAMLADGWLAVKSAPGQGTTVQFGLPHRARQ